MLGITLLNSAAELNNYFILDNLEYTPGANLDIVIKLMDIQKNIRLIPEDIGAAVTATFQQTDGTELNIAMTKVNALDSSMWKVSLTPAQTEVIIGSNMKVTLDELGDGSQIQIAIARSILTRNVLSGEDCC